jgi:hypothetical protein
MQAGDNACADHLLFVNHDSTSANYAGTGMERDMDRQCCVKSQSDGVAANAGFRLKALSLFQPG